MTQEKKEPVSSGEQPQADASSRTWTCACTHPSHFLGNCRVKVVRPETKCAECMENHFGLNDDPTIANIS
jgi:hypothetical protein